MANGNGNGNNGYLKNLVTIIGLGAVLVGWGISYGLLRAQVATANEKACQSWDMANENENAIISIKKDVERLPSIEAKLDRLIQSQ